MIRILPAVIMIMNMVRGTNAIMAVVAPMAVMYNQHRNRRCKKEGIIVRWSGEGVWIPYGDLRLGLDYENHTSHPSKGEMLLYPGGISEMEIILAYGRCCFSSMHGQLSGNHFLTITEGLDDLYDFGRKILYE